MSQIVIRNMTDGDTDEVARLSRALAGWFTRGDMHKIEVDAKFEKGLLAEQDGRVVGQHHHHAEGVQTCRVTTSGR